MEIAEILKREGFRFDKGLGQNFITDKNLLAAIAADSGATADDTVVEIGTGAGTLTRALSKTAKRVISFEVDGRLKPVLAETLKGCENVEVYFRDVLNMSDEELSEIIGGRFKVAANIPYYITTPLIMRFLKSELPVDSITVMVQKEVAERIAGDEKSADYGAVSARIALSADAEVVRTVSKRMFYPVPKIDSAVLKITMRKKYTDETVDLAEQVIKAAFAMRRKTLVNNLRNLYPKEKILSALSELGLSETARGETLSVDQFVRLAELLK